MPRIHVAGFKGWDPREREKREGRGMKGEIEGGGKKRYKKAIVGGEKNVGKCTGRESRKQEGK